MKKLLIVTILLFTVSCSKTEKKNTQKKLEPLSKKEVLVKEKNKELDENKIVIASYNSKDIRMEALKKEFKLDIIKFNQKNSMEKYQKLELDINTYAQNLILESEAKKRNLKTSKDLLLEISKDIEAPSEKEIKDFTEQYKEQLAKIDKEKVKNIVSKTIKDRKKEKVMEKFVLELIKQKNMKVNIPFPKLETLEINIKNAPVKGELNAKNTLVIFSDFQCPYCSIMAKNIGKIDIKNLKIVFKHFPLSFHKMAKKIAIASVCANKENKFWDFHNEVFKEKMNDEKLKELAKKLKLANYDKCINSDEARKIVENDIKDANEISVTGTPSLFLNGRMLSSQVNNENLKDIISKMNNSETLKENTVVISFDDKKVTFKEYLEKKKYLYNKIEREFLKKEYEFNFTLLSRYLSQRMLEDETKELKYKNVEEYMEKEFSKIEEVKESEVKEFYEKVKSNLQGKKYEEVKDSLKDYMVNMKKKEYSQKKLLELSKKYKISIDMKKPKLPPLEINLKTASIIGNKNAKNTLVVFSEFQCPYCKNFAEFSEKLLKEFPKDLKIAFKHFPLSFHNRAFSASVAAICADKQGKFEEYHDKLFKNQSSFSSSDFKEETFVTWAKEIKIDENKFKECLSDDNARVIIQKSIEEGNELGIRGTPSLFLNGAELELQSYSIDEFKKLLK